MQIQLGEHRVEREQAAYVLATKVRMRSKVEVVLLNWLLHKWKREFSDINFEIEKTLPTF